MSRPQPSSNEGQFTASAGEARPGLVRKFVDFLKNNKKWRLAPIVIFGVFLSGTAAGPFVYTLF